MNKVLRGSAGRPIGFLLGALILWSRIGSADEPVESVAAGGHLEEIETLDGQLYQGQVVGYDAALKGYILRRRGGQITLPEEKIVAIRELEADPGKSAAPPLPADPADEPETSVEKTAEAPAAEDHSQPEAERPGRKSNLLAQLVAEVNELAEAQAILCMEDFRAGWQGLAAGNLDAARRELHQLIRKEPECLAAYLLIGGISWSETSYAQAYRFLSLGLAGHPHVEAAEEMLAEAAAQLGYSQVAAGLKAERLRRQYRGAERRYRLFQYWKEADPQRALQAWEDYLANDQELEEVDSPEGNLYRLGKEALEAQNFSKALCHFGAAVKINPYLKKLVQPLRVKALDGRAAKSQETEDWDLALGDLEALKAEDPDRESDYSERRERAEMALISSRLEKAGTPGEVLKQAENLALWFPLTPERYRDQVKGRLQEMAEAMIASETLNKTVKAFELALEHGDQNGLSGGVVEKLESRIKKELAAGRNDAARQWVEKFSAMDAPTLKRLREELIMAKKSAVAEPDSGDFPGNDLIGPSGYFPLKPGSTWSYRHGDGTRDLHRLEKVDAQAEKRVVYRFANQIEFGETKVPYTKCAYFEDRWLFLGAGVDPALADRILALPLEVGHEWSWVKGEIHFSREYLSTGAAVQCRAGTFTNCLKVRATSRYQSGSVNAPAVVQLHYYAPGVGLVKIESENPLDGRELESYSLANPVPKSNEAINKR